MVSITSQFPREVTHDLGSLNKFILDIFEVTLRLDSREIDVSSYLQLPDTKHYRCVLSESEFVFELRDPDSVPQNVSGCLCDDLIDDDDIINVEDYDAESEEENDGPDIVGTLPDDQPVVRLPAGWRHLNFS